MRAIILAAALAAAAPFAALAQGDPAPPAAAGAPAPLAAEEREARRKAFEDEFMKSLTLRTGEVQILKGAAVLQVPDSLYYLDPADSERVLVDLWGNPSAEGTLGMLFPAGSKPFDEGVWGVEINYAEEGYVSDADASEINYDQLLEEMKRDARAASKERVRQGYEAVELIGWAAPPRYDAETHKLYWAKELKFGASEQHTLNYNIRVLGRRGVLNLNFIAGMDQLAAVEAASPAVLTAAAFAEGSRYEDFVEGVDKKAAYGIAGLIAGGAGLAVLKKTGLLGIALIFLKKGWILVVVALGAIGAWVRNLLGGRGSR